MQSSQYSVFQKSPCSFVGCCSAFGRTCWLVGIVVPFCFDFSRVTFHDAVRSDCFGSKSYVRSLSTSFGCWILRLSGQGLQSVSNSCWPLLWTNLRISLARHRPMILHPKFLQIYGSYFLHNQTVFARTASRHRIASRPLFSQGLYFVFGFSLQFLVFLPCSSAANFAQSVGLMSNF